MEKILISMPEKLAARMRAIIPARQRSKMFTRLIEKEIEEREKELYKCASSVEKDKELHKEMKDWNMTLQDGLNDESW